MFWEMLEGEMLIIKYFAWFYIIKFIFKITTVTDVIF